MKSDRRKDPVRWRDRAADAHALESRAAVLAEAAGQVQPLAPQTLSRIRSEIVARRSRRGVFARFGLPVPTRLAFAIGLVLLCATTVGGAGILWRKHVSSTRRTPPPPVERLPSQRPQLPSRVPRASELEAPVPVAEAEAVPAPVDARAHARARSPVRPIEAPPREPPAPVASPGETAAPAPRGQATEAGLVAKALYELRQGGDARGALATLDRHAREFPHGVLETEAFRTRVEAVIKLGDLKTALGLLDGKAADTDALGADLTLTRAELRAAAGRFREALADFTPLVDSAAGPLAAGGDERALYGRAVCLGRLTQIEKARVDLLAYQKRFPRGRFAVEVERLLVGKEPRPQP